MARKEFALHSGMIPRRGSGWAKKLDCSGLLAGTAPSMSGGAGTVEADVAVALWLGVAGVGLPVGVVLRAVIVRQLQARRLLKHPFHLQHETNFNWLFELREISGLLSNNILHLRFCPVAPLRAAAPPHIVSRCLYLRQSTCPQLIPQRQFWLHR